MHLIIATCRKYPQGNADLQNLCRQFAKHGITAELIPWQDITAPNADIILPLAMWDYAENITAYYAFLQAVENSNTVMLNSAKIQRWNSQKTYLQALHHHGIAVVPSHFLALEQTATWGKQCQNQHKQWHNPVIKPLIGQSGHGVRRLGEQLPTLQEYPHGAILQPYMNRITQDGEMCLIYLDGTFSHAICRKPADWRANSAYGVEITPITPDKSWLNIADKVLDFLNITTGETPLYARIDGLFDNNRQWTISEVELIEPALYCLDNQRAVTGLTERLLQRVAIHTSVCQ